MTSEREHCHALNILLLNIKAPQGKSSPAAKQHLHYEFLSMYKHFFFFFFLQIVASISLPTIVIVENLHRNNQKPPGLPTESLQTSNNFHIKTQYAPNLCNTNLQQHRSKQSVLNCTITGAHVTRSDQSGAALLPSRLRCAVNVKA